MALPFFYISGFDPSQSPIVLNEDTSRHVIQVLRMKVGDRLNLTDGNGTILTCIIDSDHKKKCAVTILETRYQEPMGRKVTIAISLIKNTTRFEWFLEKVAEIGIHEIVPMICERTEKQKFRYERMQGILVSAMLQSQQSRMPVLQEPVPFPEIAVRSQHQQKFIAHCLDDKKGSLAGLSDPSAASQIILIGPEGDFTKQEIDMAGQSHFSAVTLGNTRLRTETAGVVAATILTISG